MVALALALRQAGLVSPQEKLASLVNDVMAMGADEWRIAFQIEWDDPAQRIRLLDKAMEAVRANPRNWDGAKDAFYKAIKDDAGLLWALFEPYRLVAIQKLLTEAASAMREAERDAVQNKLREVAGREGRDTLGTRGSTRSGMDAASAVARLSMLDTFKVNGQPIGDCTPGEANAWAASRERDARFVRMLTANLPDGEPIRKYRRPEDANSLYERAIQDE